MHAKQHRCHAMSIKDQVVAILAQQAMLEPADISMDQTLEDIGIDSLGLVECIFAIEEAFDINVPFNANDPQSSDFDISSISAIVSAVSALKAEQAG